MRNRDVWQGIRALLNQLEDRECPVWSDHQGLHDARGGGGVIWDETSAQWVMYVNVKGPLVEELL